MSLAEIKRLRERLERVLNTRLRSFQVKGIRFLEKKKGKCILGDDMGLGKTIQVIGYLALHPELRPAIVVCPANAKFTWEDQIRQHTKSMSCQILNGRNPYRVTKDIVIINYDILPFWEKALISLKPKALVIDECHYIKTRNIKRTITCKKISQKCSSVIPMSGTPIINRPVEFFPVLNIIRPKRFDSFWKFAFRYCKPKRAFKNRGWIFDGARRLEELHALVSPVMIRRMKSEVLKELPKKQRIPLWIELSNQKEYEKARENFLKWYRENYGKKKVKKAKKAQEFVQLGILRQLTAEGKIKEAEIWINDFLENTTQKLVVFCYYRKVFNYFASKYKRISAIGGKGGEVRKREIEKFQKDKKCRLYIGSIKADKEAITLTAASDVLFIEMGWTPGEHEQAEDRVNRIGQKSKHINAYYLLAKNSIDELIWDMIIKKRKTVSRVLDGKSSNSFDERLDMRRMVKHIKGTGGVYDTGRKN